MLSVASSLYIGISWIRRVEVLFERWYSWDLHKRGKAIVRIKKRV